jgi:hypothetical protein
MQCAPAFTEHSEEEMTTGASVIQDNNSQGPESEGAHAFTEPSRTNQRTKISRKVCSFMKRNYVYDKMIALEEEQFNFYKRNSDLKDDSDYRFLMSLLPKMKQVSPDRKMYVGMKSQEIFSTEEE